MSDDRNTPVAVVENHLREFRQSRGLSQAELARRAGITRQTIHAVEAGQYLPTTEISLRLARILGCRVEDIFNLSESRLIEGQLVENSAARAASRRVKVARIGGRVRVMPVAALGSLLSFTVPGDGIVAGRSKGRGEVQVRLTGDGNILDRQVFTAGCDPAILLAGEYLRRSSSPTSLVSSVVGSEAAIGAFKRGEVHLAGAHIRDSRSGEYNLPYIRRHLAHRRLVVVRFASWEEGLLAAPGNPKNVLRIADLERKQVRIVNREPGSGARQLLDEELAASGIPAGRLTGYEREVSSHLDVAWMIRHGLADAGIGVRAAATLSGLAFIPLRDEQYDIVIDKDSLETHPGLKALMDTLVSRAFRSEIHDIGGYDTRETGKVLYDG